MIVIPLQLIGRLHSMNPFQIQLQKISNSITQLGKNEAAFVSIIKHVLVQKRNEIQIPLLEGTFEKLRERDIGTLRRIFADPKTIINLMQDCATLDVLAMLLKQHHLYLEVNTFNYGLPILTQAYKQLKIIRGAIQAEYCYLTLPMDDFQTTKRSDQTKAWNKITLQEMLVYEARIFLMLQYLVHPLVEFYAVSNQGVSAQFVIVVKWLMFLCDRGDMDRLVLISKLARRVLPIVCSPMGTVNKNMVSCFSTIMKVMSLHLYDQEIIKPTTNVGAFFACLPQKSIDKLCYQWFKSVRVGQLPKEAFQNIFTNVLESSCQYQNLKIIECLSKELRTTKNFDVLFKVYQKFVKKQLVRKTYIYPGSFKAMLDILMMYVAGFVNTDRIGEELEELVVNYKNNLMVQEYKHISKDARQLALLLTICDIRFKSLTNVTQNILKELKKIFKIKIEFSEVEQYIKGQMFNLPNQEKILDFDMIPSLRYKGLDNIGNTCYMDSFLQVLFLTKRFRLMIESIGDPDDEDQSRRPSFVIHELFSELTLKNMVSNESVKPYKFKKFLMQPFASSKEQQDSAQFGRLYLEYLLNDLSNSHFQEILENLFFNKTISQMSCKRCQSVTSREEKVLDFILPFSPASTEPQFISTLFKNYFLPQDLDDQNMPYCSRCQSKQLASNRIWAKKFSTCIILTLNRFLYDRAKQTRVKLFNEISFEFQIDLSSIAQKVPSSKYVLYAFIVHIGSHAEAGHYVTYARNIDQNPNLWYTFDDGYVTEKEVYDIKDFNLGNMETPYILFYASEQIGQSAFQSNFRPSRIGQLSRISIN